MVKNNTSKAEKKQEWEEKERKRPELIEEKNKSNTLILDHLLSISNLLVQIKTGDGIKTQDLLIPPELFNIILSYFNSKDLKSYRMTCKSFYHDYLLERDSKFKELTSQLKLPFSYKAGWQSMMEEFTNWHVSAKFFDPTKDDTFRKNLGLAEIGRYPVRSRIILDEKLFGMWEDLTKQHYREKNYEDLSILRQILLNIPGFFIVIFTIEKEKYVRDSNLFYVLNFDGKVGISIKLHISYSSF